jgi:putative photosynthetic complex assembly protein 2
MDFLLPPVLALLIWWLGTGIVLLLDGLPRDTFRWSLAIATLIAAASLFCIARAAHNTTIVGAYASFTCAVLVWGWHELAFLTGWLTGPRKQPCSAPLHGPTRFREAVGVILWHEVAIIAMFGLIVALSWDAPNPVAAWTFGLLWVMRLSAKFNLFLGVRNRGEEFLPPHLRYLGSYFRRRSMNALLPLTLLAGGAAAAGLIQGAVQASGASRVGLLLVASMLGLALLEHLLMVTPFGPAALWRWAMRSSTQGVPSAQAVSSTPVVTSVR